MKKRFLTAVFASFLTACVLCGCSVTQESGGDFSELEKTGSMKLDYADGFSVDYYDGGLSLITVSDGQKLLVVPEGENVPKNLDSNITVISQPIDNIYVAASSAMDLFQGIDSLENVRMTSTQENGWSLDKVKSALESGAMLYVGKYNAPDYEMILSQNCGLAVESTMIYHNPETKEQLESLRIPVLVERSSYEAHPLGRLEWIKLYGLLMDKQSEAEQLFSEKEAMVQDIESEKSTGKTAAFFSINSNGAVTVRKPGDYVSKMIAMAGGKYILSAEDLEVEENALSTMNMQMESFYALAKNSDYLIYNSTIEGNIQTIEQLLDKSDVLKDFAAVKSGDVWCTEKDMFQQSTGAADMISDLHKIFTDKAEDSLIYMHRLK